MPDFGRVHRTPVDLAEAQRWLDDTHGALDGVVGKRTGGSYATGEGDNAECCPPPLTRHHGTQPEKLPLQQQPCGG
jgi:hypothetical protein